MKRGNLALVILAITIIFLVSGCTEDYLSGKVSYSNIFRPSFKEKLIPTFISPTINKEAFVIFNEYTTCREMIKLIEDNSGKVKFCYPKERVAIIEPT